MRYTTEQRDYLRTRPHCLVADLFTITLLDGTIFRWTTSDQPITVDGNTWTSYGPGIQRDGLGVRNTMEIPELNVILNVRDTDLFDGRPIKQQIIAGVMDGATVRLERIFMPTAGDTSLGTILLFDGRLSSVKVSATGCTLVVKGGNVTLNEYAPKNVYMTSCQHNFCDAGCTLHAADFTISNTVGSGSTVSLIIWGSVPSNPTFYSLGKVTFTSGLNSGQVRTVKSADSSGIVLAFPLEDVPSLGDTFSIMKGCDKTYATCRDRYSNTQNYRGFPFVPPAETGV